MDAQQKSQKRKPVRHFFQRFLGESLPPRIAGLFHQQAHAETALEALRNDAGLSKGQVRLLCPQDSAASDRDCFGDAVEIASAGTPKNLVQTRVTGALGGAGLGVVLFLWLSSSSTSLLFNSPALTFVTIVGFGITFGLLAAGLAAFRPDRAMLIAQMRAALHDNCWVLLAHPVDTVQAMRVKRVLNASRAQVHSTI